jgi:heme-degrading monooxygenase HmoA
VQHTQLIELIEWAERRPGFLGVESCRGPDGLGITVSCRRSLEDIKAWRQDDEHTVARDRGRASWYAYFSVRIARVERSYDWQQAEQPPRSDVP